MVEHCLHIPSWTWCRRGFNRSYAREAFRARLPRLIIERRTKGGPDSFCIALVERNLEIIRERIFDGTLMGEGILDRQSLAECFSQNIRSGPDCHRLLALADAESWIEGWR